MLRLPEFAVPVNCDVDGIRHVIDNLLSNAAKYSPAGSEIEVTVDVEADGVVIRVADEGIGVPAADAERIFERGFRATNAVDIAEGLGLGLYVAAAIVREHGGTLSVTPRPCGSVFTCRLPLAQSLAIPRFHAVLDPYTLH
jgi:signal transduction histidine kinase